MKAVYVFATLTAVSFATPAFAQTIPAPEPPIPYQLDEAAPLEAPDLQATLQQQQQDFDQQRQFDYDMEMRQQQQQATDPYWEAH